MATPRIRRRPAHRDTWRASYCEQTSPARTCCRSNLPSVNAGRARRQQSPRCRRSVGRGGGNRTLPNHRNRWIPLLASATRRVPSGPIGSRDVRLLTPSTGAKRPPRDRRRVLLQHRAHRRGVRDGVLRSVLQGRRLPAGAVVRQFSIRASHRRRVDAAGITTDVTATTAASGDGLTTSSPAARIRA